jgi:hypothetical protein
MPDFVIDPIATAHFRQVEPDGKTRFGKRSVKGRRRLSICSPIADKAAISREIARRRRDIRYRALRRYHRRGFALTEPAAMEFFDEVRRTTFPLESCAL